MNENFEEKKQKCFNELKQYSKLLADLSAFPENKVLLDVLLSPINDKELEYIDAFILYQKTTQKICEQVIFSNKKIDISNNLYGKWLFEIITAISKNENFETIQKINNSYHLEETKNYAEYTFGLIISSLNNNEIIEIISNVCKDNDINKIYSCLSLFKEYQTKLSIFDPPYIKSRNTNEINKFVEFSNYFSDFANEKLKSKSK